MKYDRYDVQTNAVFTFYRIASRADTKSYPV